MKTTEKVIVQILKDHLIWRRVVAGIEKAMAAFDNDGGPIAFDPEYKYSGYENAFSLMGVPDDKLHEKLSLLVFDHEKMEGNPSEVAEKLYIELLVEIREYHANKSDLELV